MKSQVFTIDDLLLGRPREVRIYTGEFVLAPHYSGESVGFLNNTAYLGVVEGFGTFEGSGQFQGNLFVKLDPFYKIEMPGEKILLI